MQVNVFRWLLMTVLPTGLVGWWSYDQKAPEIKEPSTAAKIATLSLAVLFAFIVIVLIIKFIISMWSGLMEGLDIKAKSKGRSSANL